MRALICGLLFVVVGLSAALAEAPPYRAGVTRLAVQDATPFDALVAYPTNAAEQGTEAGPFTLSAARDAPVAGGALFPIVLFSHGSGRGPGTPLISSGLLLHLARQGFIVVAPFHPGGARPFVNRPRQVKKALETVLADLRFARRVDPDRVAMIGFSFGGAVALINAGAAVDLAHLAAYCRANARDRRACDGVPTDGALAAVPPRASTDALPLKALVLLEPYGAPFTRAGLATLDLPVLLYRARQSDLGAEGNVLALARALPRPPRQVDVDGNHFVFIDPCPRALAAQAPALCRDPDGFDRAAIQQRLKDEITAFLRATL